jgi:hypothetical protein
LGLVDKYLARVSVDLKFSKDSIFEAKVDRCKISNLVLITNWDRRTLFFEVIHFQKKNVDDVLVMLIEEFCCKRSYKASINCLNILRKTWLVLAKVNLFAWVWIYERRC